MKPQKIDSSSCSFDFYYDGHRFYMTNTRDISLFALEPSEMVEKTRFLYLVERSPVRRRLQTSKLTPKKPHTFNF